MKDNPDTNVQFVKMIERNPCVYNRKCHDYSNKTKQDETWAEIGKKFDATVPECKERWKNLRACFTRHLKLKTTPGYAAIAKKPYYLAQHLNFLRPFTKSRKQIGNISIPSSSSKHETFHEKEDFGDNLLGNEQNLDESTIIDDLNDPNIQNSSDTNFTQTEPRLLSSIATKPSVSTKRRWIDLEDANENDLKIFTKQIKTHTNDEDLDLCFFKSLLPDIREMNPDQKRRFKVGVINLSGTILNEDYHNIRREYQNTERLNTASSTLSFDSLSQKFIIPPGANKDYQKTDDNLPRSTLPSHSSRQKNIFPLLISKQSIQCTPKEEVPSTTNYHHENSEYHNIESRPNSAQSTLSSGSSIIEYKVSADNLEPYSDLKNT